MSDGRLFPVPTADLRQGLANLAGLLDKTFPLRAKHRAGLPRDIRVDRDVPFLKIPSGG